MLFTQIDVDTVGWCYVYIDNAAKNEDPKCWPTCCRIIRRGTGEQVGRGGRGRRPREGNDECVDDLNGQGNDQGLRANGGVEGVNGNVEGANGGAPDFSTIIAQQLQNLLPAMLAQVGNQGNVGNQNGNVVNENIQENVGNVLVNGNRVGCSYKEFLACNPKEYDGKGGVVVLTRWIEKMESVHDMSGCSIDQKVKYTAGSFVGKALTWWNSQIRTLSREVAVSMSWNDFKFMMIQEFCPSHEMQKLESELWNHAMVGAGHAAYTDRFHELARLVPHLVGRGGRGRRPKEGNYERVVDLNGQGNDQGMGANGGVKGVNGNVEGANKGAPEFSTIIAQQMQNLLPAMLAQVSNQGNVGNQNGNMVNENVQENVGNVIMNGNRVGCSYKEFLACNPKEYDGKGGIVVLTHWVEKMESVHDMSEFCPSHEMQKLESELWNHVMVGVGHVTYIDRFHELARLVPHLISGALADEAVRNGSIKKVEKRGNIGEPSKDKNGRDDNKRTRTVNDFATTVNPVGRENMRT
ncbi:reverse transcriptase domain-containing protein [Tanacetum coccineum]